MRPTYQPGDLVLVYVGKNIQVSTGDIVLFSANSDPTIHRVVAVENGMISTQGDANNAMDLHKIKQVDGKAIFAIPRLGYGINFIQVVFRLPAINTQ